MNGVFPWDVYRLIMPYCDVCTKYCLAATCRTLYVFTQGQGRLSIKGNRRERVVKIKRDDGLRTIGIYRLQKRRRGMYAPREFEIHNYNEVDDRSMYIETARGKFDVKPIYSMFNGFPYKYRVLRHDTEPNTPSEIGDCYPDSNVLYTDGLRKLYRDGVFHDVTMHEIARFSACTFDTRLSI